MAEARRRFLNLNPLVVTLGFVSLFNDIASEMIYPLLPAFLAVTLGAGPAAVGLVEGVAEATAALGKGFFGWFSDKSERRKPFVVAGYGASVFARPLIALAPGWTAVLGIRFLDRIGKGARTAPRDAMIGAVVAPSRRGAAYGFERAMDNAGAMIGPLLAALLLKFAFTDVRPVFLLSIVPGLIALTLVFLAKEASPKPPDRESQREIPVKLPPRFYAVAAVFAIFALANSTDAFLLLRARDCGVPLWAVPILWAFFSGARAAIGTHAGALSDRIGRVPSILAGWGIYAVSYFEFGRVRSAGAVWLVFLLYALYYALTEGAQRALVADLVPEGSRGRAFGFFYMLSGLAALPASALFGFVWKTWGPRAAFDMGAALALAAAVALPVLIRRKATA
jgi:MFS family permease